MSQTLKQMTTDPHRDSLRRVTATATATAPAALAAPALYRAIFAQSPDAIVVAGFDGRLVEANAAALALLGYTAEELPRLWIQDILRPSPEWSIAEALRLLGEQGLWQGEADIITRSGELVPTASHTFTLEGSAPPMLVSFLRDLRG